MVRIADREWRHLEVRDFVVSDRSQVLLDAGSRTNTDEDLMLVTTRCRDADRGEPTVPEGAHRRCVSKLEFVGDERVAACRKRLRAGREVAIGVFFRALGPEKYAATGDQDDPK